MVSLVEESVCPPARLTLVLFRVEVIPRVVELLAERLTVPLKPLRLVRVIVAFWLFPCRTERAVGLAPMLKSGWTTLIVGPYLMELLPEISTVSRLGT